MRLVFSLFVLIILLVLIGPFVFIGVWAGIIWVGLRAGFKLTGDTIDYISDTFNDVSG